MLVNQESQNTDRVSHLDVDGGYTVSERDHENDDDDDVILVNDRLRSPQVGF